MTRNKGSRLGNFLVDRGWITGEHLIRAIQAQRRTGGRLGTVLLEMDLISEEKLLQALELQSGLAGAGIDELRTVERDILALVPPRLALRHQVVPIQATDTELTVALIDPGDLGAQDAIRAAAGRKVLPRIASEIRVLEALQRFYDHEVPRRYVLLIDRMNRNRYLWEESADILLQDAPEDDVVFSSPDEVLGDDLVPPPIPAGSLPDESGTDPEAEADAVPIPISEIEQARDDETALPPIEALERELAELSDPESIGVAVLRFLGARFHRAALFRVSGQDVTGWLIQSDDVDREAFRALALPLTAPSAFVGLAQGSRLHLGPLANLPAHKTLAEVWGGRLPKDCVLLPVRIKNRLVCALYGDRGSDTLFGVDIDELERIARLMSEALELCILRRKSRRSLSGRAV